MLRDDAPSEAGDDLSRVRKTSHDLLNIVLALRIRLKSLELRADALATDAIHGDVKAIRDIVESLALLARSLRDDDPEM